MTQQALSREMATILAALAGGDDQVIARACAALNRISLTVDQFERGAAVYGEVMRSEGPPNTSPQPEATAALEAFCEREGLLPADVAATSILKRLSSINEALAHGLDLKKDDPAKYEDNITRSIHQGYFRYLKPHEIDENDKVIPIPLLSQPA